MTRLTPEERAAWEAVRMDAAQRSVALDHHTGKEIKAAREVRDAVNALLDADAGAWAVQQLGKPRCAKCGGTGYDTDEAVDIEMLCECREAVFAEIERLQRQHEENMAKEYPGWSRSTPADRDAELERLLVELRSAMQHSMTILATDSPRCVREAEDAIRQHIRQREEAARGETVGHGTLYPDRDGNTVASLSGLPHFHRGEEMRVRLVRAPEEAEHAK